MEQLINQEPNLSVPPTTAPWCRPTKPTMKAQAQEASQVIAHLLLESVNPARGWGGEARENT